MNNPPIPQQPTTTTTTPTASYGDDGHPNNPTTILKRKRTKRQRPTTNATHSSTSYNPLNSSPPSYSDFSTTTEDEDTANCLILLSKGHNIIMDDPNEFTRCKFNSKKYIQTSTDDDPNGFNYVYECKTCSRTFSSFQALGGHRASHTKPRINEQHKPKPKPSPTFSNEDEPSRSQQLQINQSVSSPRNTNKLPTSKLHECSICGAEFNSGQALGGHMRRHRAANANTVTNTTLSLIPYGHHVVVDDHDDQKSTADHVLCLDLDLNLPAPLETTGGASKQDQHRESSYKFSSNQNKQQASVYLSVSPTLVDCYY